MNKYEDLTIRSMTRKEMDFAVDLAAKEGWNPGINDAECFYSTDPDGFLVGTLNNNPVSCISAVSYNGVFGFIGFFIVIPELRGGDLGIRLGKVALKHLEGQNIGLDGVIDKVPVYNMFGFKQAYRNIRFEHIVNTSGSTQFSGITELKNISMDNILQYDRQCFPANRSVFLSHWLNQPSSAALGYLDNNRLKGYGVIRRCLVGYKIGPLFADNTAIAEYLYLSLISNVEDNSPVYLDVPEVNPDALKLAKKHKMKEVFATARMYSQGQPDISLAQIFGVTSFELG